MTTRTETVITAARESAEANVEPVADLFDLIRPYAAAVADLFDAAIDESFASREALRGELASMARTLEVMRADMAKASRAMALVLAVEQYPASQPERVELSPTSRDQICEALDRTLVHALPSATTTHVARLIAAARDESDHARNVEPSPSPTSAAFRR
jgi:hypothetical protein